MAANPEALLIVDDEELNREGLSRRLQREGYAVTAAKRSNCSASAASIWSSWTS
jgi:CheY-like chemotaxis protein